jgi:hypothetical protein
MRDFPAARWLLVPLIAAGLVLAACDDDDDGNEAPSAIASATLAATQPPAGTPVPVPTIDPVHTPGPAAIIVLRAEPQALTCDGEAASIVTALVLDADNQPVEDGTEVTFSVVASGTADPIDAETSGGEAQTEVVALGEQVGVVVNVSSGDAAMAIRIDCL